MTVQNNTNKIILEGDGVNTEWAYPFDITASSDILVYITGLDGNTSKLESGFQVDTIRKKVIYPYPSGTPLADGCLLTLYREIPLTQGLSLSNQGPFDSHNIEKALDRQTYISQQLQEKLSRALMVDIPQAADYIFPSPAPGKSIGWDSTGARMVNYDNPGEGAYWAELWSSGAEDVPVKDGKFSAFHWSEKVRKIAEKSRIDVTNFGAIGDGSSHPLSERFNSLAEAQVVYSCATSLDDEIDWCAIQTALNSIPPYTAYGSDYMQDGSGGIVELSVQKKYVIGNGKSILVNSYQGLRGCGQSTIIINNSTNVPAINIGSNAHDIVHGCWRVLLENFAIDGKGTEYVPGGCGVYGERVFRSVIGPLWISGTPDSGIKFIGCSYSYITGGGYIQNSFNYGIEIIDKSLITPIDFVTATWIKDTTIRINHKAGIKLDKCTTTIIQSCTIESNGFDTEKIGEVNYQTTDSYSINIYLYKCVNCHVIENYCEESNAYIKPVQIAMDGGYGNKIRENSLINHTALLMYSSSTVCSYNTISNNDFPAQVNPNLLTLHYASTVRPIGNRFINNEGVNWYDDLNIYTSNVFQTHGTNYGVNPSVQNVTDSIATYTPNFKPKTGTEYATNGEQPSRIIYITVKQNLTITIPTNYYSWETITFVIKQDSIGGHSVGFSGYINSWTNVGNSAGKVSTIQFLMNDVGEGIQVGSQSPWM